MARKIDDDAPGLEAQAIRRLMDSGVGKPGNESVGKLEKKPWTNEALADAVGCSEGTVSGWINQRPPSRKMRPLLLDVFFQDGRNRALYSAEFDILSGRASERSGEDVYAPKYSKKDLWDALLGPIQSNVTRLITEAGDFDSVPGLELEHLSSAPVGKRFHILVPEWFREWARQPGPGGRARYEVFDPCDFEGGETLAHLRSFYPHDEILSLIERHANVYARQVRAKHEDPAQGFPPYNKPKLGLMGVSMPIPGGADERAHLHLHCYETDYFTHRVMREVMRDVRKMRPELFADLSRYPNGDGIHLGYFATSVGLNIITLTKDGEARQFQLAVTSREIGNQNQQEKWHVSANEGLNGEDLDGGTRQIDFRRWVERALSEELGVMPRSSARENEADPIEHILFLECSVEMTNFEPFLSCLVYLDMTADQLAKSYRLNARDGRREIARLENRPFTLSGLINVLFEKGCDTNAFTSYMLQIIDLVVEKDVPAKFRP